MELMKISMGSLKATEGTKYDYVVSMVRPCLALLETKSPKLSLSVGSYHEESHLWRLHGWLELIDGEP
jgi:hypothetical protein